MALRELFRAKPRRFLTPQDAQRKLEAQSETNAATLDKLALVGVSPEDSFRVEYYFYTDTVQKAKALASDLGRLGYESEYRPSTSREGLTLVTGWTTPMPLSYPVIEGWTRHMVQLGLKYDCEFDGWGYDS
jgi:regulator of RNase E activity RraB